MLGTVSMTLWFSAAVPLSMQFCIVLELTLPCYGADLSHSHSSPMCWSHLEIKAPPCLLLLMLVRLENGVNGSLDDL